MPITCRRRSTCNSRWAARLPSAGFLFDAERMGIADISLASLFRNLGFARQRVDAERWPLTAAFVDRTLAQPAFTRLQRFEEAMMRTPIAGHRARLAELGAPLTAQHPDQTA